MSTTLAIELSNPTADQQAELAESRSSPASAVARSRATATTSAPSSSGRQM